MKKVFTALAIALTATVMFSSCELVYQSQLAGNWSRDINLLLVTATETYSFVGGDYVYTYTGGSTVTSEKGTYEVTATSLVLTNTSGSKDTMTWSISGDELTLTPANSSTGYIYTKQ